MSEPNCSSTSTPVASGAAPRFTATSLPSKMSRFASAIVDAIETLLEPAETGEIKPELMESVLEVSTDPCPNAAVAGEQLRALRRQVSKSAAAKQFAIGSAGTHPFAMWEDQRIVARPRY